MPGPALLTLGEVEGCGRMLARRAGKEKASHSWATQRQACSLGLEAPSRQHSQSEVNGALSAIKYTFKISPKRRVLGFF